MPERYTEEVFVPEAYHEDESSRERQAAIDAKLQELSRIGEAVDAVRDRLDHPVEPRIKQLVIVLNAIGLKTTQSCEGHTDEARNIAGPWVEFSPEMARTKDWQYSPELRVAIRQESAAIHESLSLHLERFYANHEAENDVKLQLTDEDGYITLENTGGMSLDTLPKGEQEGMLHQYQEEMNQFADFLKDHYLES